MDVEFHPQLSMSVVGRNKWVLNNEFRFTLTGKDYIVPAGYKTDLSSVPRYPLLYMFFGGKGCLSSVMHDFLYDDASLSRKQCDKAFYHGIIQEGHSKSTAFFMWLGVRLGGAKRYNTIKR